MYANRLPGLWVVSLVAYLFVAAERGEADPIRPSPRYTVRDVGRLPTGEMFKPHGINNRGDLVGDSGRGQVILFADGSIRTVGSHASNRINDNGQTLQRTTERGINSRGDRVGRDSEERNDSNRATLITAEGETEYLLPPGATASRGVAINDYGQVVGEAKVADGTWQAFLYEEGKFTELRAPDLGLGNSIALAINNAGQVVLLNHFEDGGDEAYLYSDGVYTPLGTLSGANGSASVAYDINELGQIIGTSSDVTSEHAFLYSEGEMFDLNELISPTLEWTLNNAVAINDSGQILVDAYGKDYGETKLLLTPVPEPSTLAVIAIGGLLLFARRRKTAKPVG